MKKHITILLATLLLTLAGCSSKPESEWPKWFDVQAEPETYFYGFGEGISSDSNLAARQARLNAQAQLAESFAIYVESEARQAGQVDLGEQETAGTFIDAIQARVQETVQSVETDMVQRVRLPDGSTRVFVRMRMPRSQGARTGREILDEFDARMKQTRRDP
ncbi:LPP20 family lipoprotein [Aliidiomarina quisquiliarum]|uniref:LPP20 family lipoprotein n=1 Tax=Aliidiomarina quisquiliarum TaxID=2938947 RepID=UPI00208F6096|nr:LPP20 family lipoprotein [Aliidiomarina quisquiliarum]MCO4322439.1 LPP20 family lipoprotein [Aliidiomarina quisquiliarum]